MLFKGKISKKIPTIRNLISEQKTEDSYILDDKNAIIVIKNLNKQINNSDYEMIHERVIDGNPEVVNHWYLSCYHPEFIQRLAVIKDFDLWQNESGSFNSLYDYKNDRFVIPPGLWDDVRFYKQYNGFLASFEICSYYEEDDRISYINPVTNQEMEEFFIVRDGIYYAMINFDGTIRDNKLFKGSDFSRITSTIDLEKEGSLEEFKRKQKQLCNDLKNIEKREYYRMIKSRNNNDISPYKDQEVLKILEKKK